MKVHLMFPDDDFDAAQDLPVWTDDLVQDLQLAPVLDAMSGGDAFLAGIVKPAVLLGCPTPEVIDHRHRVLRDCEANRDIVTELYELATAVFDDRQHIHRTTYAWGAESRLHTAVSVLEACLPHLHRLRDIAGIAGIAEADGSSFTSPAFRALFATIRTELDEPYLARVAEELDRMRLRNGMLLSGELGEASTGVGFVLREPDRRKRGLFRRAPLSRPTRSFQIAPRDDAGFNALADLRDLALTSAASAATESVNHVVEFFTVLRQELAFYLGSLHLADALKDLGHDACVPEVTATGSRGHRAVGVYDVSLALDSGTLAVPSDLDEDARIVIVTGANRGGKSTFLRALGIAALLARCGSYAPCTTYRVPLFASVHTHFRREEDETLASGKLDEELTRMATLVGQVRPGSLLLSNESFSSTNEREGSQIADDVLRGLADSGVDVVMVTHMYELAERLRTGAAHVAFLRAERLDDGTRTFRIVPGLAEPTSHARDLYQQVFDQPDQSTTHD